MTPRPSQILEYEPLSKYCTLEIGGPARYLLKAQRRSEIIEAVQWARAHQIPWVMIGRGSNTLFDDRGFVGLVIVPRLAEREFAPMSHSVSGKTSFLLSGAFSLPQLAATASRKGYSGLEFACGIPGSLAGAVYMNAGAHGGSMSFLVERVDFLDENNQLRTLPGDLLEFGYRKSVFQKKNWVILSVQLGLELDSSGSSREKLFAFAKQRRETQPQHCRSAGCFFRNPEQSSRALVTSKKPLSAGALIDKAGLKGLSLGKVQISAAHANFLVHLKGTPLDRENKQQQGVLLKYGLTEQELMMCKKLGPGAQMRKLIALVRNIVKTKYLYNLETEVRYLPFEGPSFQMI